MSTIKQVLELHACGFSNRSIAKELGLYKETANEYIRKVKANGFSIAALLALENPVLKKKFSAGNPAYKEEHFEYLKTKLNYFEPEFKRPHVTRGTLWCEYRQQVSDGYSYSQFCFHQSQLSIARHPSVVLVHRPGESLFYVDRETDEIISVQVFVACLAYSDYTFAMAVRHQPVDGGLWQSLWLCGLPRQGKKTTGQSRIYCKFCPIPEARGHQQ